MQAKPKMYLFKQTACQLFFSSFLTFFLLKVKKLVFLTGHSQTQTFGRQNLAESLGIGGSDFAAPFGQGWGWSAQLLVKQTQDAIGQGIGLRQDGCAGLLEYLLCGQFGRLQGVGGVRDGRA